MRRRTLLKGLAAAGGLSLAPRAWADAAKGRWLRLESPNFVVYSTLDENKSRAELVALERFQTLLTRMMPRTQKSALKLSVYIAGSNHDFEVTAPAMGKDVGGFYMSHIEEVRAVTAPGRIIEKQRDMPKNVRALDARVVLFHEYTHHFVRANSHKAFPPWYNEGFSEYLSTADFSDTNIILGKFTANRAQWLALGDWMDIKTFLGQAPKDMSRDDRSQFYAQAWLVTHFLFNRPERAKGFDVYVAALQAGADPIGGFEAAFGVSPEAFDKELRDYKRKPMTFMQLPDTPPDMTASITVERLPTSADDLLMPVGHLRGVPKADEAAPSVAAVRDLTKKFEGDPFAMRARALAEIWYGDLELARKTIDAQFLTDTTTPELQHLSGLCDLRSAYAAKDAALAKRARKYFTQAHRLDGTRASSLFRYVEAGLLAGDPMDEHFVDVLVAAYQLAPQIDVLAMVTGQALIQHKRYDEAIFILSPMMAELHSEELSAVARVYVDAAKAQQQPKFRFYGSAKLLGAELDP